MDDLLAIVVEDGCGFRPSRKGGVRLDVERIKGVDGDIPLVFNYGCVLSDISNTKCLSRADVGIGFDRHGGGGYQSSWGTANIALDLLEKALAQDVSQA